MYGFGGARWSRHPLSSAERRRLSRAGPGGVGCTGSNRAAGPRRRGGKGGEERGRAVSEEANKRGEGRRSEEATLQGDKECARARVCVCVSARVRVCACALVRGGAGARAAPSEGSNSIGAAASRKQNPAGQTIGWSGRGEGGDEAERCREAGRMAGLQRPVVRGRGQRVG